MSLRNVSAPMLAASSAGPLAWMVSIPRRANSARNSGSASKGLGAATTRRVMPGTTPRGNSQASQSDTANPASPASAMMGRTALRVAAPVDIGPPPR